MQKTASRFVASALCALVASAAFARPDYGGLNAAEFGVFAGRGTYADGLHQSFASGGAESSQAKTGFFGPNTGSLQPVQSYAAASLYTGKLHAGAYAGTTDYDPNRPFQDYNASAVVRMKDTVTLTNTGEADLYVPYSIKVDGQVDGTPYFGYSRTQFWFDGLDGKHVDLDTDSVLWTGVPVDVPGTVIAGSLFVPKGESRDFSFDFGLATLAVGTSTGTWSRVDYTHTISFNWDLPDSGVSFTSLSGAFNPGGTEPVPEPASMVALGAGALAMLRRRTAKRRA